MNGTGLKEMMEAGLHFGHQTKRWNPKMKKYIFGARNGIYIIDLQKTVKLFHKALAFARELSANGGTVLFIGTKPQAHEIVQEQAIRCGMPYVNERWLGGMLTNFETIKNSVSRLKQLESMEEDGSIKVLVKKEIIRLQKEKMKLQRYLGGIAHMDDLPDAVFIVDTKKERIALAEALKLSIPVTAIVDTNCDPEGIEYIIPGNDDAHRAISLVATAIADALLAGASDLEMKEKALVEEREKEAAEKKKAAEAKKAAAESAKEKEGEAAAEPAQEMTDETPAAEERQK